MAFKISAPQVFGYTDIGAISIQNVNNISDIIGYEAARTDPKCRTDAAFFKMYEDFVVWKFEEPIIDFDWKLIAIYGLESKDYIPLAAALSGSSIIYDIGQLFIKISLDFTSNGAGFEVELLTDYQIHTWNTRSVNFTNAPNTSPSSQPGAVHNNLVRAGAISSHGLRNIYARRNSIVNQDFNLSIIGSSSTNRGLVSISDSGTQIITGSKDA